MSPPIPQLSIIPLDYVRLLIAAWDQMHRMDLSDIGFADFLDAMEQAGVTIGNDMLQEVPG